MVVWFRNSNSQLVDSLVELNNKVFERTLLLSELLDEDVSDKLMFYSIMPLLFGSMFLTFSVHEQLGLL